MINIDYNNDRIPHFNLDTNGDRIPDTNLVNKDINNDGRADLNIDIDNDGYPDINLDMNNENLCSLNCDTNGDNKADINIDTNGDGKADINIDTNGDGKADINIDTNGDGKADLNIDTNDDGKADLNIDTNGDGEADLNIDTNGDGVCDFKCYADLNNANLKNIKVHNYVLTPSFDPDITDYEVKVDEDLKHVVIRAEAENPYAKVKGTGNIRIKEKETEVSIVVEAVDGTEKTYTITIIKEKENIPSEDIVDSIFDIVENELFVVSYTKGIDVKGIVPGWNGSQLFTLTNKSDKSIVYNVNLIDVVNTFKSENFKYTLIKDGKVIVNQTSSLRQNGAIYEKLIIAPGETADFELKFDFIETNQVQNEDINVRYSSKLEIQIVSVN